MWTAWLLLTLNGLFFTLRLAGNTGSFPKALTREEEQDCLERMAQGDTDARDKLIEHNLRLVAHIVKKYYTPNGDQDDLISIGTIGLIKGVSTFKADKNVRLATYASRCIENAILSQRPKFRPSRQSNVIQRKMACVCPHILQRDNYVSLCCETVVYAPLQVLLFERTA